MTPGSPLLSIHDLNVEFQVSGGRLQAVRDVSLEVPAAGIVALIGESGSGKTTLARAVLQLEKARTGRICLRGEDLLEMNTRRLRDARKDIQAVFQDPHASLSPRRSIRQTLLEPLNHFDVGPPGHRLALAREALNAVGLEDSLLARYPHELSGGQRQRVALARALVTHPALIIADEPLSSLDVPVQIRIMELLQKLRGDRNIAFLVVSHDLSVVRKLADTVAIMYLGRLVETGPTHEVFRNPAHPYTRSLLAAAPVADPAHPRPEVLRGEPPSPLTPPAGCVFHRRCKEAVGRCSTAAPGETTIAANDDRHKRHCVRCHLWES